MAEAGVGERAVGEQGHLQPGLKRRHMTMISLGGIIGAGLFVGTGPILNQAGPATVLTYLLTGALLILIMRMLREMAVAQPSVGSFSVSVADVSVDSRHRGGAHRDGRYLRHAPPPDNEPDQPRRDAGGLRATPRVRTAAEGSLRGDQRVRDQERVGDEVLIPARR
jgi:Amino acid permease